VRALVFAGPVMFTVRPASPAPLRSMTDTTRPPWLLNVPGAGVTVLVTTTGLSVLRFFAVTVVVIRRKSAVAPLAVQSVLDCVASAIQSVFELTS
jgi:hypothetical protein